MVTKQERTSGLASRPEQLIPAVAVRPSEPGCLCVLSSGGHINKSKHRGVAMSVVGGDGGWRVVVVKSGGVL